MDYKKTKYFLLKIWHNSCYVPRNFINFIPNLIQKLTFKNLINDYEKISVFKHVRNDIRIMYLP